MYQPKTGKEKKMNFKKLTRLFQSENIFTDENVGWICNGFFMAHSNFLSFDALEIIKSKNESAIRSFFKLKKENRISLDEKFAFLEEKIKNCSIDFRKTSWIYQNDGKLFSTFIDDVTQKLVFFPFKVIDDLEIDCLLGNPKDIFNPFISQDGSFVIMPMDFSNAVFEYALTKFEKTQKSSF